MIGEPGKVAMRPRLGSGGDETKQKEQQLSNSMLRFQFVYVIGNPVLCFIKIEMQASK